MADTEARHMLRRDSFVAYRGVDWSLLCSNLESSDARRQSILKIWTGMIQRVADRVASDLEGHRMLRVSLCIYLKSNFRELSSSTQLFLSGMEVEVPSKRPRSALLTASVICLIRRRAGLWKIKRMNLPLREFDWMSHKFKTPTQLDVESVNVKLL
jgi:hypothetical protein